jgi:cytoskeleton protein RodZ
MQTIGERLEEARKKKGISIREAAEATKIRGDYLSRFESNEFDIGLTEIYTRGFLRNYATFLKLPADRIINDYTALGRSDARPRQPSREIYGRMDISVASVAEPNDRAAPPEETPAENNSPTRAPNQPRYPRGGNALPSGPDPALIFKYIKWGGIAVVALIALLVIKSIFTSSAPAVTPANTPARNNIASRDPTIGLIALNPVHVTVSRKNADGSDGEVIFSGMLATGETKPVARPGALYIQASAAENLQLEVNGKRYDFAQWVGSGFRKGELPPPTP